MTAPALVRQADITRILNGAKASDYTRVRLLIDPHGNIVVDASDEPAVLQPVRVNPLDRLLGNP